MGKQIYHVNLSKEDKKLLRSHLCSKKHSQKGKMHKKYCRHWMKARVINSPAKWQLGSDLAYVRKPYKNTEKFATEGLQATLERKQRAETYHMLSILNRRCWRTTSRGLLKT